MFVKTGSLVKSIIRFWGPIVSASFLSCVVYPIIYLISLEAGIEIDSTTIGMMLQKFK